MPDEVQPQDESVENGAPPTPAEDDAQADKAAESESPDAGEQIDDLEPSNQPETDDVDAKEPVDDGMVEEPAEGVAAEEPSPDAISEEGSDKESEIEKQMLAELEEFDSMDEKDDSGTGVPDLGDDIGAEVKPAEFQQFSGMGADKQPQNLDLLIDVVLPISIELGRTNMSIQDILNLGPGSVVELNKLAGEPVDLLVNNKIVAKGEVVVIDENFGLRVTSLISPEDRLKSLGE